MDYPQKPRTRVAFVDEETLGIGPNGCGLRVRPGGYIIAEVDGLDEDCVMVEDPEQPGTLLAILHESTVEIHETVATVDHVGWAAYRRRNPHVVASWGEQNGRVAPATGE